MALKTTDKAEEQKVYTMMRRATCKQKKFSPVFTSLYRFIIMYYLLSSRICGVKCSPPKHSHQISGNKIQQSLLLLFDCQDVGLRVERLILLFCSLIVSCLTTLLCF